MAARVLIFIAILALVSSYAYASDPGLLQDFCVAVNGTNDAVFVNGKICKDPATVTADDFFFTGLNIPGDTNNPVGAKVTRGFVDQFPGINTLGVSMARIDYSVGGLNPPHFHPRGSEILHVVEGTLYAGFVTANPTDPYMKNQLFAKILNPGDAFTFPQGLIHFQLNVGDTPAVAFASFGSQKPGVLTIANALFGSAPPIETDVLTKGLQVDKKVIDAFRSRIWVQN